MKHLPNLIVTVVVAAVATTATAVGVVLVTRDNTTVPMGPSMLGMQGSEGVASEPEYLAEMVAHHREAVAAARQLARSGRSEMRAFGESIVKIQSAQIEQMRTWLAEWYPDQSMAVDYQAMMRDLSGLSEDRLDRAFLHDMIGHHMAAVMLSQHLLRRGTYHHEVARLARSIRDDQHTEIIQMQRWLSQWFDAEWRGGMGWSLSDLGRAP